MLKMTDLAFEYSKDNRLFTDIQLELKRGSICGLLGKNGAGKTTLLKIISGLLFPKKGSCEVLGQLPRKREAHFLSNLYFLTEDLFVPQVTINEYIQLYAPFYPAFDYALLENYLTEFSLPKNKLLPSFSHGQKKKFLLSFGLATNCQLLILDEPTNGLDIPSKAQFKKLLASTLNEEKLIIISTHQVHDIENLIDTIVVLDNGKIIFNHSLEGISQKLAFSQQHVEPEIGTCLYFEKRLNGYALLTTHQDSQDNYIDLEILFNAILSGNSQLHAIFNEAKTL